MKKLIQPTISTLFMGMTAAVSFYTPSAEAQFKPFLGYFKTSEKPTPVVKPMQPAAAQVAAPTAQPSVAQPKLERVKALAMALKEQGLMYSLYLNPVIEADLQNMVAANNLALLEPTLTTLVNRMTSDLSRGRVLPTSLPDKAAIKVKPFAYQAAATNYLNGLMTLEQLMASVTPHNSVYAEALSVLKTIKDLKDQNKWTVKPAGLVLVTLKKGLVNPAVIAYGRMQLANMGYWNNTASTVADADLDTAIKNFQADNGLTPDGFGGANTWKLLDKSVDQLMTQAMLNLDRTRWLPDQNSAEYIYINLARQTFQYFENDQETLSFHTVNGRVDRQTPMMVDVAREVVLNPTWTVPRNLFIKDKLPKLRLNPGFIGELHAKLFSDVTNLEVDPYTVDWNQDPSLLPYTIVQTPGPWNALGRIKFPLTNAFSIYMHDTNERNLFVETDRLRSSGCMRLERPFDVGAKLLKGTSWTAEALMNATELAPVQAEVPTSLSLKRSVPVYVAYKTLSLSGTKLISTDDSYGVDAAMYTLMFSGI